MDQWLKFYKEHDVSIYHEGYVYVFYRELDSLKPDANPELRSSYHCSHNYNSLNKCHARIYTTGNWEIDKLGRGYQWGMFRKERHNHEPHHKDTIQRQKFYKHDETTLLRDGFFYTFYRGLDILKPGVDPQWRYSYHCIHSEDGLLCRGRIHTTGEWKTTKRDRTFQWGVFKNVNHNHDPDTDDDGKALASTSKYELQSRETEYHAGNMENYEEIYESNQKTMQAMSTPKIVSKRGKLRECSLCCYNSRNSNHMKQHLYTHIDERPHSCDQCPYACIKFCDLIRHLRCHTGERPYECIECDYASPNSTNLKSHMLSHSGLKPYKCGFCPKAYTRNSSLKEHMRTHTGEKPYKCDLCPYAGNKKYHLERHQLRHHQNVYGSITKERKSKKHERDIQNEADETGISLLMDRTPAGTTRKNSKRVKTKKQLADCTEATQISDEKFSGIFSPLGPSRLSRERIKTEKQTYICADPDTAQTDCEELSGISSLLDSPVSTPNQSKRIEQKKQTDSAGRNMTQGDEDEHKSDDDILIAEKILDKRRNGNRTEYLVKFLGYEDIDDQKWVPVGMLNCTDMILEYERSRNEDVKVVDKRVKDGIAQYKVKKKNRQRHFWASASDLEPYRILILKFEKSLEDKAKFCDAAIVSKSGLTHSTPTAAKRSSPFPRIPDAPKSKSPKMKEKSFNDVPFNISTGTITKSCIPVPSYRKLAIFNKC